MDKEQIEELNRKAGRCVISYKECQHCGKEFPCYFSKVSEEIATKINGGKIKREWKTKDWVPSFGARFCSNRCRMAHKRGQEVQEDRICFRCHKPYQVRNKLQRFCSSKCSSEQHTEERRMIRGLGKNQ